MSFHLLRSSLITLNNDFEVLHVQTLHFFCEIYFKYFILIADIVNGIILLISLLDYSLVVYRNKTDFCKLSLHHATLLNFTSYQFLGQFLRFSI